MKEMFSPQRRSSEDQNPGCPTAHPTAACDVKLMFAATQKGPEPWFRAPEHFQRCSKESLLNQAWLQEWTMRYFSIFSSRVH